ncbi:MAG: hypothetical protein ABJH43_08620 [Tateyamaria sp.]|uniref:hypothetical protein n=2 Tax=Tateyamaria sp. TaxID=1929288 RepID=UPI0032A0053E
MNVMSGTPGDGSGEGDEPPIILVGIEKNSYYIVRGDEFLNELLLVDGEYPKPILCLNFDSIFDAKRILGDDFSLVSCWAIHPEIIARLRKDECLIESDE